MSRVKIATAPCSFGVWYRDGTPSNTPYEVFLDMSSEAGYLAAELGPFGYLPTDIIMLKEELDRRGMEICSGTSCYNFAAFESFEKMRPDIDKLCKHLQALKAPYMVTMDESDVGRYSERKKEISKDKWLHYFNLIQSMNIYTFEKYGIKTVFHPHVKSIIEYEDEIQWLLNETEIDLCFDTGHHAYCNGGVEKGDVSAINFIKNNKERIAYLHFKNVDSAIRKRVISENLDSDQAFDIGVMCDLEDGIIDFVDLKKVLDDIEFCGIGVIEQDVPKATTIEAFDAAKRNLGYLGRIGII